MLSDAEKSQIQIIYDGYQKKNPDLIFNQKVEPNTTLSFNPEVAMQLGQKATELGPRKFIDVGGKFFSLKARLKWLIFRIARPALSIALTNQMEFNSNVALLAQSVVLLEARVQELEQRLRALNT